MLPACSAHYATLHPAPDLEEAWRSRTRRRGSRRCSRLLYGWFRETADLWSKVLSDRVALPELDRFLDSGIDDMQRELVDALAEPRRGRRPAASNESCSGSPWTSGPGSG